MRPRAEPSLNAPDTTVRQGHASSAIIDKGNRMKLLLVDDDEAFAATVRRGLESEGFTVEWAPDGDDGYARALEGSFDLVILDVLLPGRNGYRVSRDLRAAGVTAPIIMLTAKSGDLDEVEGLELGADDWLTKPFSWQVLVARIHALLRRSAQGPPPPVAAGSLRLDPVSRRVVVHDREVDVTTREFDLLEFMVRRPDRVLSKSAILAGVWNDDFEGDPNIVEVYVARLRRKLRDARGPEIETIRGAGYRLVVR